MWIVIYQTDSDTEVFGEFNSETEAFLWAKKLPETAETRTILIRRVYKPY